MDEGAFSFGELVQQQTCVWKTSWTMEADDHENWIEYTVCAKHQIIRPVKNRNSWLLSQPLFFKSYGILSEQVKFALLSGS